MTGDNDSGQLGIGTFITEETPCFVQRIAEPVSEIACGDRHTLMLARSGSVFCMGDNSKG